VLSLPGLRGAVILHFRCCPCIVLDNLPGWSQQILEAAARDLADKRAKAANKPDDAKASDAGAKPTGSYSAPFSLSFFC
jgi:hypothetical protein